MRFTLRWLTGHNVAHRHGEGGEDGEEAGPVRGQLGEAREEDAGERREVRRLDGDRHEGRHDRGRPLVNVGGPRLEGNQRHLEAEADQQEGHAEQNEGLERVARRARWSPADPPENPDESPVTLSPGLAVGPLC
jgi:hypothetical protein